MRRLCGYDLNGWRDQAARNWLVHPGGEVEETEALVSAGLLTSVVRIGDPETGPWIGGAQAALAPQGRGAGWGDVGRTERRKAVRDLLGEDDDDRTEPLAAALAGHAAECANGVLALDDVPRSAETKQEKLLAALRAAGVRDGLLVWRPVLVALDAIRRGVVDREQTIGVICHDRDGFSVQKLRIRQEAGRARSLLAPERRQPGMASPAACGYAGLLERAERTLSATLSADGRARRAETPRALGRLALGAHANPEILRAHNGDWIVLEPPVHPDPPRAVLQEEAVARLQDCERVLFETLAEGDLRHRLRSDLEAQKGRAIELVPLDAVARGALDAARRRVKGEPIYFDFLPRISTIVQVQHDPGAESYDLVRAEETLPAGRRYRSPEPARLSLQPGQDRIAVHLFKEAEPWPRKATVELGTTVSRAAPIDLWVEQTPAAGSAQILLRSPALAKRHTVDWEAAEEIEKDWDTLVAELATPAPTIPERLVLPCGLQAWHDSPRGPGLFSLLSHNVDRRRVDWDSLAARLSSRPEGRYCISSDGELPDAVPEPTRAQLTRLTERAVAELEEQIAGRAAPDTGPLKFLTWQFRLCPASVADNLISALEGGGAVKRLFSHPSHWKLALQGLGRIAGSAAQEQAALGALLERRRERWNWQRETACTAFLLSRSDSAPTFLSRADVEALVARVVAEFRDNLGTDYTRFYYAPFLLVGLLRWRLVDRYALVAGRDPAADRLDEAIDATLPDLRRAAARKPALRKYLKILEDARDELRGEGSNPELLMDIYRSASSG